MHTIKHFTIKLTVLLLLVAALFGSGLSPVRSAAAACLTTDTFNLWAKTGTATLYTGTTVTIWGYSSTVGGAAGIPGPVLVVNKGDCVVVNLTNNLSERTAINFQGQSMVPDTTGATASGGTKTYLFTATNPGTYLYEAGLILRTQHQAAMGMYGVLIVRSATAGQAYNSLSSAYTVEVPVVLSEIDPLLNNNGAPANFDMRKYAPKYFLINGKSYASPFTGDIPVIAGDKVLLRYVNAGLQSHAMSTLGISQLVIATDGSPFTHPHSMIAETIATGQTLDAVLAVPASTVAGTKYAIYDANMQLHNTTSPGLGGMLTFLAVGTGSSPATGPLSSGLALSQNPANGSVAITISASVSDVTTGGTNVNQAEFYIDNTAGTPTAMTGAFPGSTVAVSGSISTGVLAPLASGNHTVYVRGHDSAGWGPFNSIVLNLDKVGPTTSALVLSPNPTNGTVDVALTGTASDTASGNNNITAAEYSIDGGAAVPMTVNLATPTAGLSANILAATVNGLSSSSHTIAVRSRDALGNWGAYANITFIVDKAGPATSGVTASPNPNNGSTPYNTSTPAVRVFASFSDGASNIVTAEGFLEALGATGTGFVFIASDGSFNSPTEDGFSDIPLAVIAGLTAGNHPIYVHAKDAAGNWGAISTMTLVIDNIPPTLSSITLADANPTNAASVNFLVTFSESVNGLASTNFTLVTTGVTGASITSVTGSGATRTVTVGTGSGNGTVGIRMTSVTGVTDLAGNALSSTGIPYTSPVYTVDKTAPTFTSVTLTPNSILVGTATVAMTVNGAADNTGGSGVSGGEYWVCPATCVNPANGGGAAFSGTSASIPTALLSGSHQYSVRVRIRDAAGNWSTGTNGVRIAVLTVTQANNIFTDGFELGTLLGNWTSRSTNTAARLNVTTGAALLGGFGLQAQGNASNYVQFDAGSSAALYDARFYFNPNATNSNGTDIFAAATTGFATQLFHVRYRLIAGPQAQVQIQVGATANATWVNITPGAHRIEVVWQAVGSGGPNPGSLVLYVDGVSSQTLATTSTGAVASIRLGVVTGGSGTTLEFFDAFSSKNSVSPLVGP